MNPNYVIPTAVPVSTNNFTAPPMATNSSFHVSLPQSFNDGGAREFLSAQGWPAGLQDTFVKNLNKIAFRFFICDDSGSMASSDGHKLVDGANKTKALISCSRWSELTEALKFHAALARCTSAPTEFRLLNGAAPILIGTPEDADGSRYNALLRIFNDSPNGGTPLCRHIREVIAEIQLMAPQLRASSRRALVVICTDGESSDGDIAQAMLPLKNLPVWVVIRLCTDEDRIVEYWNGIDTQLELDMDVLDDLCGEAGEIAQVNPWLNYGEPLHRLREFGIPVKELDLLDEAKLSLEQVRAMCAIIYGGSIDSYPHPEADWKGFVAAVEAQNKKIPNVWNPAHKRATPWILTDRLKSVKPHGEGGCIIL